MAVEELPDPPPAPEIPRRIMGYPAQWVGMALLALLPILTLAGVFGEVDRSTTAPVAGGYAELTYPARIGHRSAGQITIVLRAGAVPLPPATVHVTDGYLSHFTVLNAWPVFDAFDRAAVPAVPAGETARLVLEVRPNRFGRKAGTVTIAPETGDTVRVIMRTLVFP
jgi:hypothetical protein